MRFQKSRFIERHRKVKTRLAAKCRQHGIRLFLLNQLLNHLKRQRLNVYMIGDILVGHDGRRVRVEKHCLDALFME